MPEKLIIQPNRPVYVSLIDPAGAYDHDLQQGTYQTTAGQEFTLPRQAVIQLNMIDPKPGEEIRITKHWAGTPGSHIKWTVALSGAAEKAPSSEAAEAASSTEPADPAASIPQEQPRPITAPIPISRQRRPPAPGLFDTDTRGTGTYGPVRAISRPAGPIPANVATKEILEFINADPNTANWSAEAKEALAETIFRGCAAAGHIGLWERRK